ncbi:MAG: Rpn family recombination-promoting nuclease/putative transposase [Alphaproteobacteria bacterium]|nr:Rpn family recombination-promoting nuclease/putative transposase [Alphaproteobacteria bacterium]
MLTKYLNPKNDVAFKRIFGTEKNKDILIPFLNDRVDFRDGGPVTNVTFLKTIQDPEIAARKTSIVDILCEDQQGNKWIVEMQVAKHRNFEKRAQYYAAKAYIAQMPIKAEYQKLKEVIFLAIANFVMFPNKKAYKSDPIILDRDSYEHDLKDFSFTFLELPKLKDKPFHPSMTMIEKWAYFFNTADKAPENEITRIIGDHVTLQRAYHELDRFAWSEEDLQAYEQSEKQEADYQSSMDQKFDEGVERGMEKGRAEGKEEGERLGIEKGKAEGLQEGIEKGREEEKLILIQKMLASGLEKTAISQITGVPLDQIDDLINRNKTP